MVGFAVEVVRLMPSLLRGLLARERNVLSQGRLTVPQLSVLDYVAGQGGCTMGTIASVFRMRPSAVTAVVSRLVELDLLRRGRSETDRRTVSAEVTTQGRRVIGSFHAERRRMVRAMFGGVPERDRAVFLRAMRGAVAAIERSR